MLPDSWFASVRDTCTDSQFATSSNTRFGGSRINQIAYLVGDWLRIINLEYYICKLVNRLSHYCLFMLDTLNSLDPTLYEGFNSILYRLRLDVK